MMTVRGYFTTVLEYRTGTELFPAQDGDFANGRRGGKED